MVPVLSWLLRSLWTRGTRRSLVSTFMDFLDVFTALDHPQGTACFEGACQHHVWQGLFFLPHALHAGCVGVLVHGDTRHKYSGVGTQTCVGCWLPVSCERGAGCSAGTPQRCPGRWEILEASESFGDLMQFPSRVPELQGRQGAGELFSALSPRLILRGQSRHQASPGLR